MKNNDKWMWANHNRNFQWIPEETKLSNDTIKDVWFALSDEGFGPFMVKDIVDEIIKKEYEYFNITLEEKEEYDDFNLICFYEFVMNYEYKKA